MNAPAFPPDGKALADAIAQGDTLVDVWAPWCGACKALGLVLDQMAPALPPGLKVEKVNMEEAPDTMAFLGVQSLPTLLLFREGRLVNRRVGSGSRSAVEAFLAGA